LLALAEARGLELTSALRARVDACSDPARLEAWLHRAATADNAGEAFGLDDAD
jgi:hypothetical protein